MAKLDTWTCDLCARVCNYEEKHACVVEMRMRAIAKEETEKAKPHAPPAPAADRALDAEALLEEAQAVLAAIEFGDTGGCRARCPVCRGADEHGAACNISRLLQRLRARKQGEQKPC